MLSDRGGRLRPCRALACAVFAGAMVCSLPVTAAEPEWPGGAADMSRLMRARGGVGLMPARANDDVARDGQGAIPLEKREPLPQSEFERHVAQSVGADVPQFGYDLFLQPAAAFARTGGVPAGKDYVVGPKDEIRVTLWGNIEFSVSAVVDREGRVSLPKVGVLPVAGLTYEQLQNRVRASYELMYKGCSIDVTLDGLRSVTVYVVGSVVEPGAYTMPATTTVIGALMVAGGPTKTGSLRSAQLLRNDELVADVDPYALLLTGRRTGDHRVASGDVVFVPAIGPTVAVAGSVRRAAIYELKNETRDLKSALDFALGLRFDASAARVQIERTSGDGIVVRDIDLGKDAPSTVDLRDGDVVVVAGAVPKPSNVVHLKGNVARPGRYQWREGMRVSDLLSGPNALIAPEFWRKRALGRVPGEIPSTQQEMEHIKLSEAMQREERAFRTRATREFAAREREKVLGSPKATKAVVPGETAEAGAGGREERVEPRPIFPDPLVPTPYWDVAIIRRIDAVTLEEKVVPFNLKKAVVDRDATENRELRPGDTVVVFAELEFRTRRFVRSAGELAQPGMFPLFDGMRVSDVVAMSGGLGRGAYLEEAELTRKSISASGATSVRMTIDLAKAMQGLPEHDVPVENGDYLLVRAIPEYGKYPTVKLSGEVRFPGEYGIVPEERLSSLIERAGGFTDKAYPRGLMFTRESTRRLQQAQVDDLARRLETASSRLAGQKGVAQRDIERADAAAEVAARTEAALKKVKSFRATGRIAIRCESLAQIKGTDDDLLLEPSDRIVIPVKPSTVSVIGNVSQQTVLVWRSDATVGDYLDQCGGATPEADLDRVAVLGADGSIRSRSSRIRGLKFRQGRGWTSRDLISSTLEVGDTIVVPVALKPTVYPGRVAKDVIELLYQISLTAAVTANVF